MKMKLEYLIGIVSNVTGVDIVSKCRDSEHVNARAIYYDIAYNKLRLGSLASIGKSVNRDHATVLHSVNNVFPHLKRYYRSSYNQYKEVLNRLAIDESFDASKTTEERLEDITDKYNDLLAKYEYLVSSLDTDQEDERANMIKSIRRIPSEKLTKLKVRLDAILRMI